MHGAISHAAPVSGPELRPIAFFAHERGDARVIKRVTALQDQGREVLGFMFHRVRDKPESPATWENIHLGTTYNRRYLQRLWAFVMSIGVLWANRERLGHCSILYVVNTDNALLALLARFFPAFRCRWCWNSPTFNRRWWGRDCGRNSFGISSGRCWIARRFW